MARAGEIIDEADVNDRTVFYLNKAATESVTSSAAIQDDDDLFATLTPGTYRVELLITASGASGGDISVTWTFSGTASTIGRYTLGPQIGTADSTNTAMHDRPTSLTATVDYGTDGTNASGIREDLLIDVTVTGVLRMRWAQRVSSGTATQLSTSSRMFITKVEEWPG